MLLTDSMPCEMMIFVGELMTKSKGIGRGGRRKGAGRPRFAKTGKTSHFSTRLTPKTRSLLEAEARRRGESLSEVAEDLLQLGLEEIADLERPKPNRALLFLISALINGIRGPHREDAKYGWHSNGYMFAALRAGIIALLDKLRPPGEIVTPPPGPEEKGWNEDEGNFRWQYTFPDSPEDYARNRVELLILQANIQHCFEVTRQKHGDEFAPSWEDSRHPEVARLHYGFVDAHRDLNLAIQRRKEK
jgi:hypothetical protein